jgi:RimJ/RimL family protein N-acetyltransferase
VSSPTRTDIRWPFDDDAKTDAVLGRSLTLRPLRDADAPALVMRFGKPRLHGYITAPPTTLEGFRRFIRWTADHRDRHVCLGIVPERMREPVGLIQLWPIARSFDIAEWGFILDDTYWGTGLFMRSAQAALDLFFGPLGVQRLEPRSAVPNGRGNGVLHKLGATMEGRLRQNFRCAGTRTDHYMWSLLASEWPRRLCRTRDGLLAGVKHSSADSRQAMPEPAGGNGTDAAPMARHAAIASP